MLGKPGCHLCDEALAVIERVAADLDIPYEVRDITCSDQEEKDEYWEKIPVTFIDGAQHDFWRVSESRLRAALAGK
ncbi:glutaredoxin family protein [Nocardiopsis ansamitocini]|nr:glutaredoxin family protein [Nocardiopsis ansamitocini]